jgi:hypothetical protein
MKVTVIDVHLLVDTRDPAGGENIIFMTVGDRADFFVYPDPAEVVDGVAVWKILEWRDRKIDHVAATSETSWGRTKFSLGPHPRTTPRGVVRALTGFYRSREIWWYSVLFDREEFLFVFDERDVQENPDIPVSWRWPEERAAHSNMFDRDLVKRVQLDFALGTPVSAGEADIGGRPFPEGTMKVPVSDVRLVVEIRDPAEGHPLVHALTGGRAEFFVYRDRTETWGGVPVWKIFEWRDGRAGAREAHSRDAEMKSWGSVKALFH